MPKKRETRSEHARFLKVLEGRSAEERARLSAEHAAYLDGKRETDVALDEEPGPLPARVHARAPTGKDVSYLRAQKRLISQQRRAVAAKTVAGSGRKPRPAAKAKDDDGDYIPEEEDDLDEEDDDPDDEDDDPDKEDEKTPAPTRKKAKKKSASSKKTAKPGGEETTKPSRAKTQKKPRKPSAAKVAKEKEKAEKRAAAERRCEATAAAEARGAAAHEEARKKLEEVAAAKKRKKQTHTKTKEGPSGAPKRKASTASKEPQRKRRKPAADAAQASATTSSSPRPQTSSGIDPGSPRAPPTPAVATENDGEASVADPVAPEIAATPDAAADVAVVAHLATVNRLAEGSDGESADTAGQAPQIAVDESRSSHPSSPASPGSPVTPPPRELPAAQDGYDTPGSPPRTTVRASAVATRVQPAVESEYEVLDSDCDDTETEICFVDDDEELERQRNAARDAEEDDPNGGGTVRDDEASDSGVEDCFDSDSSGGAEVVQLPEQGDAGDGSIAAEHSWPILGKADMVDFAKDDANMVSMRASGWMFDPEAFPTDERYPGLFTGDYGPTDEVLNMAESPLKLFFFFMPHDLWKKLAKESNRFFLQNLTARVERMYEKQRTPGKWSKEWYMRREAKKPDIKPHEILHVLGLLMARMLNPQRRRFRDHWGTTSKGAVPRGTFSDFMARHRFEHIMANLHFTNNANVRASTDRAWKVRSVIDTLQETFPRGYKTPPVISFDEGILPLRNRNNPTRQYLKAKPHKWGTKLFLTCCAETAYCMRLEVYCGKAQHTEEVGHVPESQQSVDPNTGPAAVIRNLEAILPAPEDEVYHLVVTDRFYTSVQLAFQLLHRNVYSIGTITGDKVGYPLEIVEKNRDRPKTIAHGTTRMAVAKNCPLMTGLVWWDRKPVQFLGTGSSRAMETCQRRTRATRGQRQTIPCPSMVRDYHRWMGGVDVHDQLRLQRYSLQMQTWCKKYYKSIFMGLVDVAIVNAYIVFREAQKRSEARPITHSEFLMELHAELLGLREYDFTNASPPQRATATSSLPPVAPGHEARECPEYQVVKGVRKRRQRQCKVCSILKHRVGERRATKYYCAACSTSDKARLYLCERIWPQHFPGNGMTCSQIWHIKWRNGTKRPKARCGRDIQSREAGPGKRASGKRKRQRRSSSDDEDDAQEAEDEEEQEADEQQEQQEHEEHEEREEQQELEEQQEDEEELQEHEEQQEDEEELQEDDDEEEGEEQERQSAQESDEEGNTDK